MTLPNQDMPEDDTLETTPAPKSEKRKSNLSPDWREATREDLDSDDFEGDDFTDEDDESFDLPPDNPNRPSDDSIGYMDDLDDSDDEEPPRRTPPAKGPSGFGC